MQTQIYQQVEPINQQQHGKLRIKANLDASFAATIQSCPVTELEFFPCSHSHPILFAKDPDGEVISLALMGLKRNSNVHVQGEAGSWVGTTYMPAFLRRYPFIQVRDEEGERSVVGMDMACKAIDEAEGEALFDEEGNATAFVEKAAKFLESFDTGFARMKLFAKKLEELELLEEAKIEWTLNEAKNSFGGFMKVDEKKLNGLDDETMLMLVHNGYYKLIMAHLFSQANFQNLIALSYPQETQQKLDA
ncbi:SapC family protein [Magnetococcus sp. PR-3]|uniref:SapC family protein n=1 Tax=Magnetococcus sp. PR-3 TaxID=3120355 RepID=UPI002FCE02F4